jgi:GNAT superfamily N-acetyltransferase
MQHVPVVMSGVTPGADAQLAARAHTGHIAFLTLGADRSGGAATRIDGALAFACGHPFPFLNGVIAEGTQGGDEEALLDRASAFLASRDRPEWSMFARGSGEDEKLEQVAEARGLTIVNPNYPEMVTTEGLKTPALDSAVVLREVAGEDDVAAYWAVCRESYASLGFPPEIFEAFANGGMLRTPALGCLARLDGTAVGAAMVLVLEGVGVVLWVGATPAARGRGVGAAVTAWVTNRAFEEGADFVSLQASPMGTAVYERIGYRHLFGYRVWRYAGP